MLDLDLLRSFVSVIDAGGFTRAGERVHRTQSTVSQQIRRLEAGCGRPPGPPISGHQITGTRMRAAVDQKHWRLPGPPAGRLNDVKIGDGCLGKAAEPADVVVTVLRGSRRPGKRGARDSGPLCDLTTRHARFACNHGFTFRPNSEFAM
jgi:hypothetical protein